MKRSHRGLVLGGALAVGVGGTQVAFGGGNGSAPSALVSIVPCRLMDTRATDDNVGVRSTPLGATETVTADVWGTNGECTIPESATAIAANVTAVNGSTDSFLTLFPADVSLPRSSNLNWAAGSAPTPNNVNVKLSADAGQFALYNHQGSVDVIIDVVGYYEPAPSNGGPKGETGATGVQGAKGDTGANRRGRACRRQGADKGDQGDHGEPGTNGTNGTNGDKGDQGRQAASPAPTAPTAPTVTRARQGRQRRPRRADGTNGTNGVSGWERTEGETAAIVAAPNRATVTATCGEGKKVVGGGITADDPTRVRTFVSGPSQDDVWSTTVGRIGAEPLSVTAWAICVTA